METFIERFGARVATTLMMAAVVGSAALLCALGLLLLGYPVGGQTWNYAVPAALIIPLFVGTPLVHSLVKSTVKLLHTERQLTLATRKDPLTGLYNRQYFFDCARLCDATDQSGHFSILMLDLDRFKSINDEYGHPVGDRVLKNISGVIQRFMRQGDICARYGGEEFVCLLPETAVDGAQVVAERIRQGIEGEEPVEGHFRLSVSIGIASHQPGETLEELIERADRALYQAKAAGRNQVVAPELGVARAAASV